MAELKRLYVSPAARGHRIGRRLVAELIGRARSIGHRRVVLDSYYTMFNAHDLYRGAGFRDTAAPPDFPEQLKPVVVFMELDLSASPTVVVKRTSTEDPDFVGLVEELDSFLAELNGEQDAFYKQYNRRESLSHALVAYLDGDAVGCGGLRAIDDTSAEIKRMYVLPGTRRLGAGVAILTGLEAWGAELGFKVARLETSRRLDAALNLYRRSGYTNIANYGPYADVEDSVCLEKTLT